MHSTGSPRQIHVYAIEQLLATGGVGSVYLARHQVTQMPVALKVMRTHARNPDAQRARFLREVRAAARIGHPGIVRVYDAGETDDGELYLAMELLEGRSLEEALAQETSAQARVGWMAQILEPLKAAHDEGIVHRDLKPANVFLVDTPRGVQVKLLDFGIAWDARDGRVTQTGIMLGTPYYMSPEQALTPSEVGPESDIWSFGVMLYEALTGEVPFLGESPHTVVVRAASEPHPALLEAIPDLMPELAELVDACLEKDPSQRLSDANVVLSRLRPLLGNADFEDNMARLSTARELTAQRRAPQHELAIGEGSSEASGARDVGSLRGIAVTPGTLSLDALDTVAPLDVSLRRARKRYARLRTGGFGLMLLAGFAASGLYIMQREQLSLFESSESSKTEPHGAPTTAATELDDLPRGLVPEDGEGLDFTAHGTGELGRLSGPDSRPDARPRGSRPGDSPTSATGDRATAAGQPAGRGGASTADVVMRSAGRAATDTEANSTQRPEPTERNAPLPQRRGGQASVRLGAALVSTEANAASGAGERQHQLPDAGSAAGESSMAPSSGASPAGADGPAQATTPQIGAPAASTPGTTAPPAPGSAADVPAPVPAGDRGGDPAAVPLPPPSAEDLSPESGSPADPGQVPPPAPAVPWQSSDPEPGMSSSQEGDGSEHQVESLLVDESRAQQAPIHGSQPPRSLGATPATAAASAPQATSEAAAVPSGALP